MRVILHSWCQIQRTSYRLRYATCGPGHIQSIFSTAYLGFNIHVNVRCCLRYTDICMRVILQIWCHIQSTYPGLRYVNCGPGHIQCNYSYVYSDFKIQVDQYALLL
jgi:hypothetical protein